MNPRFAVARPLDSQHHQRDALRTPKMPGYRRLVQLLHTRYSELHGTNPEQRLVRVYQPDRDGQPFASVILPCSGRGLTPIAQCAQKFRTYDVGENIDVNVSAVLCRQQVHVEHTRCMKQNRLIDILLLLFHFSSMS